MADAAYELANAKLTSSESTISTKPDLHKVYRKVDVRVSWFLCGIYFLQFIDKSLLNYAGVMGIKDYLKKGSDQFSNLGTMFFVGFIVGEPISAYLFQKLPAAKLLSFNIFAWGIIIIGHAFSKNYASLMVVRTLLGLFEACVAPGCVLVTGMWYNQSQQLRRLCWWTCQAGFSTIIGGLLSFAFQHVKSESFQGWQIFYLVMGVITAAYGILVGIFVPDSPVKCNFLSDEEKVAVLQNIKPNNTGTETYVFKWNQVRELFLKDKHTYVFLALTLLSMIPTGAVLTFSVQIIANIGFSNKHAALMQMPLGVTTILAIVIGTYLCAHFHGRHRNLIFISMLVPAIIGYIVLISSHNKIGQLLAVYLINVGTCVITMIYSWNSANTAGYTKRVVRNCITMIFYAVGCLIGPQLFRAQDAPRYLRAKITLLVIECVCIPITLLVSYISRSENIQRESISKEEEDNWVSEKGPNYQFLDLTDKENIHFRYSY
ncbi:hypothetical protein FDK38_004684 [Candidozyma auris]|nr:hypothetical protein FDK38_004684 [[Candida] auris]